MDNHMSTLNDENVKLVNPQIVQNFDDLQEQINLQRTDNDHMQKQVIELKKEKSKIQQQIMLASHKIAELEDQIGL